MDARFFFAFGLYIVTDDAGRSRPEEDDDHADPDSYAGLKGESDHSRCHAASVCQCIQDADAPRLLELITAGFRRKR